MKCRRIYMLMPVLLLASAAFSQEAMSPQERAKQIENQYLTGEKRAAIRAWKIWRKEDKKAPWPYVAGAQVNFHAGKFKRCIKLAKKAVEYDAHIAEAYYWRGRCYEERENKLEAANEFRAAIKVRATYTDAHEALDRVQASLGTQDALPSVN